MVGEIFAGILGVHRITVDLIDDEQRGFQSREGMRRSDFHPKGDM